MKGIGSCIILIAFCERNALVQTGIIMGKIIRTVSDYRNTMIASDIVT